VNVPDFMKQKMKWTAFAVIATLLVCHFVKDHYEELEDEKRRALFHEVHKGMNTKDVRHILGTPDRIYWSFDSSTFYYTYYTRFYDNPLRSGMPEVVFDSLGKVEFASFGD
jgi:outer membrane protein assembly factor BamE (lipoprotein component of BamABCDE complex)